ncbi:MAG: hypothetical protein ACYTBZ_18425, partial [Planctomycetota bacterium]
WSVSETMPPYTALWSTGGHPNKNGSGPEHWSVRRWISEVSGKIGISGTLAKQNTNCGDGITGKILVNGNEIWSQQIAWDDSTGVNYLVRTCIGIGDSVDFAIKPNNSDSCDGTAFRVLIVQLPAAPDPDGDNVSSECDNCPDTVPGATVDGEGCPYPPIPGDYDRDGDVDNADYDVFESCASGPNVPYTGDCSDTDFDNDLDTDQEDFGIFQRCYSGEDNPADPNCAS